jgi:predicted dehydrogenase
MRLCRQQIPVAVIGTGPWGLNHVRLFSNLPGSRVRYLVDIDPQNLSKARRLAPDAVALSDYRRALRLTDCEAAIVATPAESHFGIARAFLAAGKHVLVEKPMTLKAAEALELCIVARRTGAILMVGHILLYHPALRYLKDSLLQNGLGPVTGIRTERLDRHGARPFEDALWGFAPHDVSMMLYLLGRMPIAGRATDRRVPAGSVRTAVSFALDFPDNVIAVGNASWLAERRERRLTVIGRSLTAVFDDVEPLQKLKILNTHPPPPSPQPLPPSFTDEPLRLECEHFLGCVRRNERPLTDGDNGLAVVSVLNALEESMLQHGATVRIGAG